VKAIFLLLAFISPLQAQLYATFQTTKGNVVVQLQYDKVPKTVANFITLANGSRPWVDPLSGKIRTTPFYNGIKFHRTDSTLVIAQAGSPKGDGTDGPGYTIKDEFNGSLTYVPYVLAMANAGPNTNGSQFFFTGNVSQPSWNNVYSIFGLITDSTSRSVVDAIIAAGPNGTTINGVTFSRTGTAAIAFNELGQNLPVCSGVAGHLNITRNVASNFILDSPQPAGTVLQLYRGTDLKTWSKINELYQGTGSAGSATVSIDTASLTSAFYLIPLVTYSDALAPASLVNRTLTAGFGSSTMTFHFDSTGNSGTATYSGDSTHPTSFTVYSYAPSAYTATWIFNTTAYGYLQVTGAPEYVKLHVRPRNRHSSSIQWAVLGLIRKRLTDTDQVGPACPQIIPSFILPSSEIIS